MITLRLVEPVGRWYRLSATLLTAAGPFWRQSWELHAFVSHLVSHFDDPLEHLLDDYDQDDPRLFDVSFEYCELLATKYRSEFMPLPAEWYRALFRSKLESLDVPEDLIREARLSYVSSTHDLQLTCRSLIRLLERLEVKGHGSHVESLSVAATSPPVVGWAIVEGIVEVLIQTDGLPQDELNGWMEELIWEED